MLDYTVFGFWEKCLLLNDILSTHFGLFLRFYERRNKCRYQLRKKRDSKNKLHSEISACAIQKFNGYEYVHGFSTYFNPGNKMVRSHAIRQCPYCENFFKNSEEKLTAHVKCCAGQAGYFYVFNNSIVNYLENFSKIDDLPFSIYYDFKTRTGSAIYPDAKCTLLAIAL